MKMLLSLLLVLLAVFYGTPRQACMCTAAAPSKTVVSTHACCKSERDVGADCMSRKSEFCRQKSCCGMGGKSVISLASSIRILTEYPNPVAEVFLPSWLGRAIIVTAPSERISQINRAPPRLTGMGTSKTYLYKQTFLI